MTRKIFGKIYKLKEKHKWLDVENEAFQNIIFDECDNEENQDFVIDLLHRINYISQKQYREYIDALTLDITTHPELDISNTLVTTMSGSSKPDSSHEVIYAIKISYGKNGLQPFDSFVNFQKSIKKIQKNNEIKNIVIVDEFIGSGITALNQHNTLVKQLHGSNLPKINIYIKTIAASICGLELLAKNNVNTSTLVKINRGISDFYETDLARHKIEEMIRLEGILNPICKGEELPSLGHGKCESLYCREEGNTPNNVLPIFWWPCHVNGIDRKTILHRTLGI